MCVTLSWLCRGGRRLGHIPTVQDAARGLPARQALGCRLGTCTLRLPVSQPTRVAHGPRQCTRPFTSSEAIRRLMPNIILNLSLLGHQRLINQTCGVPRVPTQPTAPTAGVCCVQGNGQCTGMDVSPVFPRRRRAAALDAVHACSVGGSEPATAGPHGDFSRNCGRLHRAAATSSPDTVGSGAHRAGFANPRETPASRGSSAPCSCCRWLAGHRGRRPPLLQHQLGTSAWRWALTAEKAGPTGSTKNQAQKQRSGFPFFSPWVAQTGL